MLYQLVMISDNILLIQSLFNGMLPSNQVRMFIIYYFVLRFHVYEDPQVYAMTSHFFLKKTSAALICVLFIVRCEIVSSYWVPWAYLHIVLALLMT